jgi:hypothetical protein
MNHIEVGVKLPLSNSLFWASAELGVPITSLATDAQGNFVIQHASVSLTGHKASELITFIRQK